MAYEGPSAKAGASKGAPAAMTAELARSLWRYDAETGLLFWRVQPASWLKAGSLAGSVNKADGYVAVNFGHRTYRAHRLAWLIVTGNWPLPCIDHVNGARSDNRWANLREASRTQNNANARLRSDNKSGFKGVSWDTKNGKWAAVIRTDGHNRFLGYFSEAKMAAAAYMAAARAAHGKYARAG